MAITVMELLEWLASPALDPSDEIGIDDGGLTLLCVGKPNLYLEIGGIPEPDEATSCDKCGRCLPVCVECHRCVDCKESQLVPPCSRCQPEDFAKFEKWAADGK